MIGELHMFYTAIFTYLFTKIRTQATFDIIKTILT